MSDRFDKVILNGAGVTKIDAITRAFKRLEIELDLVASNRETSLYLTHLEMAAMWATKAVSRDPKMNAMSDE